MSMNQTNEIIDDTVDEIFDIVIPCQKGFEIWAYLSIYSLINCSSKPDRLRIWLGIDLNDTYLYPDESETFQKIKNHFPNIVQIKYIRSGYPKGSDSHRECIQQLLKYCQHKYSVIIDSDCVILKKDWDVWSEKILENFDIIGGEILSAPFLMIMLEDNRKKGETLTNDNILTLNSISNQDGPKTLIYQSELIATHFGSHTLTNFFEPCIYYPGEEEMLAKFSDYQTPVKKHSKVKRELLDDWLKGIEMWFSSKNIGMNSEFITIKQHLEEL